MREGEVFCFGRAERATCLLDKHNSQPGAYASPEPLKERERSLVTVLWMWSTGQRVTMTIHGDLLSLDSISPPCFLRASPNQQHVGTDTLCDTHTHSHTGEKKPLQRGRASAFTQGSRSLSSGLALQSSLLIQTSSSFLFLSSKVFQAALALFRHFSDKEQMHSVICVQPWGDRSSREEEEGPWLSFSDLWILPRLSKDLQVQVQDKSR